MSATPLRCWRSAFGPNRSLVAQAEHALRFREPGGREFAELGPALPGDAGKGRRRHYGTGELARNLLQSRREVDGRPYAGEVEPAHAADIAEQNFADMERDTEAEALGALAARITHGLDAGARFARRIQHAGADLAEIAAVA